MSINYHSEKGNWNSFQSRSRKNKQTIKNQIKSNQRCNTPAVIDQFKSIPNKAKARFIKIEFIEIYRFITEKLLDNTVAHAEILTIIPDDIIELIKQARKSPFLPWEIFG